MLKNSDARGSVIRSAHHALIAITALIGPDWLGLVSEASASYCPIEFHHLTDDSSRTSDSFSISSGTLFSPDFAAASTAAAEPLETAEDEVPLLTELGFNIYRHTGSEGAGSTTSSTHNHSPGGSPGIMSEVPAPAVPFITRLRIAQERVAFLSTPRSVFEPPRAI